jgi:hypothetical protein
MTDAYEFYRGRNRAKLRQWKTGTVTLTRTVTGDPDPSTPWIPGSPTSTVYTLDAVVTGVSGDQVDDTLILATDLQVIASPSARLADGTEVTIEPQADDVVSIDGEAKVIKRIDAHPAAGLAARFDIFVGS